MSNVRYARKRIHEAKIHRAQNIFIFIVSIFVAYELFTTGVITEWVHASVAHALPGSFIAGFFFTSLFTLIPAAVVLAELSQVVSPWLIALCGAAGAVVGDLFLFFFVRKTVDSPFILTTGIRHRLKALMRHPFLRWVLPITGALIIASPLPDELGLALMGFSRISLLVFIPISFAMNFLGILSVEFLAGSLLTNVL